MAKSVKVELNERGVREFLRSPAVEAICKGRAVDAVARLGKGYKVTTYIGKYRANASVGAVSFKARRENMQTNSILKALR